MAEPRSLAVAVETGSKRVVASAVDWPGWTRSARDENAALQALIGYAHRYARAIGSARLGVPAPGSPGELQVAEHAKGNASTDYGIPGPTTGDMDPPKPADLERLESVLSACWKALEAAATAANGRTLRKGPRGGGRELDTVLEHVVDAHAGYLSMLGYQTEPRGRQAALTYIAALRAASHDALRLALAKELPTTGPRGGKRWMPRYFVRRAAWHILDHAWEIEDRTA